MNFTNPKHKYQLIEDSNKKNNVVTKTQIESDLDTSISSSDDDDKNQNTSVTNPLFNIDDYLDTRRSCAKNSFLNVITATIRSLMKQQNATKNACEPNEMIEMKLQLPSRYFNKKEMNFLKNQNSIQIKHEQKASVATSCSTSIESDSESSQQSHKKLVASKNNNSNNLRHGSHEYLFALNRNDFKTDRPKKQKVRTKRQKPSSIPSRNRFSLNSLSAFNLLNRQEINDRESSHRSGPCLFLLVTFTILINPIFGVVALLAALKSRKVNNYNDSVRLANTARQTSLAGIFLSLFCVALAVVLYFLHEKFLNVLHEINTNQTISTNSTSTPITTVLTSVSSPKPSTSLPPSYDRLSVLIEHDFLELLKQKYKLLNETLKYK